MTPRRTITNKSNYRNPKPTEFLRVLKGGVAGATTKKRTAAMTIPATAPRSVARTIAVISILLHIKTVKETFRMRRELKTLA